MSDIMPVERIERTILLIRGQKVMLDRDLAELYGVPNKALKQAVRRNIERFPSDFMFVLTNKELTDLRSQFVTSSPSKWGGTRHLPFVFTEQGVAMLSTVLKSKAAIAVNIQIMRAFVRLRQLLASHEEIRRKLEDHDKMIAGLFDAVRKLMTPPPKPALPPKRKIGFHEE